MGEPFPFPEKNAPPFTLSVKSTISKYKPIRINFNL